MAKLGNNKLDKGLILCFFICLWFAFLGGMVIGEKTHRYKVEKKAVKEGRAVIEEGQFKWLIKGEEK